MAKPPRRAPPIEPLNVQVFLDEGVGAEEIEERVRAQVEEAVRKSRTRFATHPVEIGRISKLAKSYNLRAPQPIVNAIRAAQGVVGILPENSQVMLKPVKRRVVTKKSTEE